MLVTVRTCRTTTFIATPWLDRTTWPVDAGRPGESRPCRAPMALVVLPLGDTFVTQGFSNRVPAKIRKPARVSHHDRGVIVAGVDDTDRPRRQEQIWHASGC